MKYAQYIFLSLTVLLLAACSNGISTDNNKANTGSTFGLLDLDGDGDEDDTVDRLPLVRAHFYEVSSASVHRRPQIYPLANTMACRIDDAGNCQPPIYKESVHVVINGTGSAGDDRLLRPTYLSSLTVEFELGIEGSRRCLDQAIDAIEKKASLSIGGLGVIYDAVAYANGGSGGTVDATVNAGAISNDRPFWGNYQSVAFYALKECAAVERYPQPEPLPVDPPTDPTEPQPRPLPAE